MSAIRREMDHVVVLNKRQLRRLLKKYLAHYHGSGALVCKRTQGCGSSKLNAAEFRCKRPFFGHQRFAWRGSSPAISVLTRAGELGCQDPGVKSPSDPDSEGVRFGDWKFYSVGGEGV